jgi:hypothetical protein
MLKLLRVGDASKSIGSSAARLSKYTFLTRTQDARSAAWKGPFASGEGNGHHICKRGRSIEAIEARHPLRLWSLGKAWELIEGKQVCREDDSGPMGLKTSRSNHHLRRHPWRPRQEK